jgi:hypothetical protein
VKAALDAGSQFDEHVFVERKVRLRFDEFEEHGEVMFLAQEVRESFESARERREPIRSGWCDEFELMPKVFDLPAPLVAIFRRRFVANLPERTSGAPVLKGDSAE